MLYCFSILFFVILIIAINVLIYGVSTFWWTTLAVVLSVVAVILIDGVFAFIVRWILPQKWFSVENKSFVPKKWEIKFYEKIGIKKWKDLVLELGFFTSFSKSKLSDPYNDEYVKRFIVESNFGIVVHIMGCIFGFLILLIYPSRVFSIGIPVSIVNIFYNMLSVVILRYNLPKLFTLHKFNIRNSKKREEAKQAV